jgi:hypothetical protein
MLVPTAFGMNLETTLLYSSRISTVFWRSYIIAIVPVGVTVAAEPEV